MIATVLHTEVGKEYPKGRVLFGSSPKGDIFLLCCFDSFIKEISYISYGKLGDSRELSLSLCKWLSHQVKVGTIHLEQKESRVRVGIDMGEVGT